MDSPARYAGLFVPRASEETAVNTGISKEEHQQGVLDFVNTFVIVNGNAIAQYGAMVGGIRQLSTADMSETLAAFVSGQQGRGHRTMKSDLSDDSEVKGATNIYTLSHYPKWAIRFASDEHINRYFNARRIFLIEYYKKDDRVVVDIYVVSGQDPVFRQAIKDWKKGRYTSDNFCLLSPQGSGVARHGVGYFRLPLACRVIENEQGKAEISHWDVEACIAATDLAKKDGVDALSRKQKEKYLCKKVG
jgi:hypothetical protein